MMILSTTSRPPRFEQYLTQKCVSTIVATCTGDVPGMLEWAGQRAAAVAGRLRPRCLASWEACRSARLLSTWALLECCRALPFLMSLCPLCHALMFWFWHPIIFSRERGIACHLSQFKVVISKDFCLREEMQAWAARWTQMDGEMLWHRTAGPACPSLKRKNRCEGSCEPKINYMICIYPDVHTDGD